MFLGRILKINFGLWDMHFFFHTISGGLFVFYVNISVLMLLYSRQGTGFSKLTTSLVNVESAEEIRCVFDDI